MSDRPNYASIIPDRELSSRATGNGVTWAYICKSGRENPDSKLGVFAGDEESYSLFWDKLEPIVFGYHYKDSVASPAQIRPPHPPSCFQAPPLIHLPQVLTTRIRVARNLKKWPFPSSMTLEQRIQVCMEIEQVLKQMPGIFLRIGDEIPSSLLQRLQKRGFWFDNRERFLKSAGIYGHWPEGRAIFVSNDWNVCIWVNEEEHLRLMSVVPDFDLPRAVAHLLPVLKVLEQHFEMSYTEKLGFLTSCPTNLGTGCRVSVHAHCSRELISQFQSRGLVIRSKHGEQESLESQIDDVYDIYFPQRLGITESEIMTKLHQALVEILG